MATPDPQRPDLAPYGAGEGSHKAGGRGRGQCIFDATGVRMRPRTFPQRTGEAGTGRELKRSKAGAQGADFGLRFRLRCHADAVAAPCSFDTYSAAIGQAHDFIEGIGQP